MTSCIALLRGINVGRAKRIAMAELRALIEELGFTEVRTLLNSGNVVFRATRQNGGKVAAAIAAAIASRFGLAVSVVVLTDTELDAIIAENPLPQAGHDPSKMVVAFLANRQLLTKLQPLLAQTWAPEAICLGSNAAYLWCADGINDSMLVKAFTRATGEAATSRNWATVIKLQALAAS